MVIGYATTRLETYNRFRNESAYEAVLMREDEEREQLRP